MSSYFLLIPILLPMLAGASMIFVPFSDRARRIFAITVTTVTAVITWILIFTVSEDAAVLIRFTKDTDVRLMLDGAGKLFAALIASLWSFALLYAFEYMKHEDKQRTFYGFYTATMGITLGIAMSGNMLTMYMFYEALTLSTVPLVACTLTKEAVKSAKKYMVYSIGGAAFAFVGIAYLIFVEPSGAFTLGGYIGADSVSLYWAQIIYVIAFIGFGVKAAIFPLHAWLPSASVAPTPVTALLHAVAVVKAGAFAIIRLTHYAFGADLLRGTAAQYTVIVISAVTILFGSAGALRQFHLKKRLAYSTVSNLSYILLGVSMMSLEGLSAAFLHFWVHSIVKIVAFFAVGAIMHFNSRENIYELDGISRKMPITSLCFAISALALTGIPPLTGFISKFMLCRSAVLDGSVFAVLGAVALIISAILTAVYMLKPAIRMYFPHTGKDLSGLSEVREANALMLIPMIALCVLSLVAVFFSNELIALVGEVLS